MYSYVKVYNGIGSDKENSVEKRVLTGQRTAKENSSYYWKLAFFKKPLFINTHSKGKKANHKISI